jgi:hypothetical protein
MSGVAMISLLLEHAALLGLIAAVLRIAGQAVELGARLIDLAHRVLGLLRDLRDFRDGR